MARLRRIAAAEITHALGAAVLATFAASLVLEVWNAPFDVPWSYQGDGNFYASIVKAIVDHGWHLENPNLGAPGGQQLYDFPIISGENLQALIVRLLAFVVSDWATVMNVYFLLTFALAAFTAFLVLRRLRVATGPALVCSTLFSLLPFHFARGERELFFSGYFTVPLGAYLVLCVLADEPLFERRPGRSGVLAWASRRSLATAGLCLVIPLATGSFYYAMFPALLVIAATLLALLLRRGRRAVVSGVVVVALIAASVAINVSPWIVYRISHGPNAVVGKRGVNESEIFALKMTQLVLPIEDHRIGVLADRSTRYAETAPFGRLGRPVHLGIVGAVGFAWLLAVALATALGGAAVRFGASYRPAATASLVSFLIGTVGGISALIAALVTPQFRAWNRISIFIAFFALLAVGMALTSLAQHRRLQGRPFAVGALLAVVLVVGVLDQTSRSDTPDYGALRAAFDNDARFVGEIERRLPDGAAVFELPYVQYPEAGLSGAMGDYDLARPYLHSDDLRWSFGASKGRPEDAVPMLALEPPARMLPAVADLGFVGLYVDRVGYPDRAARLEREISSLLGGTRPLVSDDGRLAFFDLRDYLRSRDAS